MKLLFLNSTLVTAILCLSTGIFAQAAAPIAVSAEVPPLRTDSETLQSNFFSLGLHVGSSFDDNALSNNLNRVSDFTYEVLPSFVVEQELPRLSLLATYNPGFSIDEHFSQRRYFSQRGSLDSTYRLREHMRVQLHGAVTITTNPFNQLDRNLNESRLGLLDQANSFVTLPRTKQTAYETSISTLNELSARTMVGLSGSFSDLKYNSLSGQIGAAPFINSLVTTGRAFVSHQFSVRQKAGLSYDFQDIDSPNVNSRLQAHSFQIFDEFDLGRGMKVSVFGGPEYSHLHNQVLLNFLFFTLEIPVNRTMWSAAGGAAYSWTGSHRAFRADFVRKISDGGGLIGAVRLHGATADFRQDLTRRWSFDLAGNYASNTALGAGNAEDIRSYSGSAGFTRTITEHVSCNVKYERLHQRRAGSLTQSVIDDHNRVAITLEYDWQHGLKL